MLNSFNLQIEMSPEWRARATLPLLYTPKVLLLYVNIMHCSYGLNEDKLIKLRITEKSSHIIFLAFVFHFMFQCFCQSLWMRYEKRGKIRYWCLFGISLRVEGGERAERLLLWQLDNIHYTVCSLGKVEIRYLCTVAHSSGVVQRGWRGCRHRAPEF